jgi:hypothetical protein
MAATLRDIMSRYAEDTSVSVEKTRAAIETLLTKYGAERFAYMTDERGAKIGFAINGRSVRFDLPLPSRLAREFREYQRGRNTHVRSESAALEAWEQACRSRWRALLLCIKAKLEACAVGITTFDSEFLAHIVTGDGRTVAERIVPQLTNGGPLLLTE